MRESFLKSHWERYHRGAKRGFGKLKWGKSGDFSWIFEVAGRSAGSFQSLDRVWAGWPGAGKSLVRQE